MATEKETLPVFVSNGACAVRINLDDVVSVLSDGDHSILKFTNHSTLRVPYCLGVLLDALDCPFLVRIHRCNAVNINHVVKIFNLMVELDNGEKVLIGRTYATVLNGHINVISALR